jgi:sulfide dehydrogenase cytochrome subunit
MRRVKAATCVGGALVLLFAAATARAQSASPNFVAAPPGATACLGCHGAGATALPSLARLSADEITTAMAAFRDGTREATLMNRIAKGFTPDESKAIADWLSAQQGKKP